MKRAKRPPIPTALLVLAGHVVVLALLALEVPGLMTPPMRTTPEGVVIRLAPPLPVPPSAQPRPRKFDASVPSPIQIPPPAPPTPQPPQAEAEAPNLAKPVFRTWPRPLPGGTDWTSALAFGCDDPDAYHLSKEAREKCLKRWAKPANPPQQIAALMPREKREAFARRARCRDAYELAPVPSGTASSEREKPIGSPMLNPPAEMTGLGHPPSVRDCPPGER